MAITDEDIKKITLTGLFKILKNLSIGALVFIIPVIFFIAGVVYHIGYKIGYSKGLSELSIHNPTLSLKQLSSAQKALLKEIWKYQKSTGGNKLIINRNGFIFDDARNEQTAINIAVNVLSNRADQTRFEDLILSMPEYFLKRIPSARYGDPYVLSITEEARNILDKLN